MHIKGEAALTFQLFHTCDSELNIACIQHLIRIDRKCSFQDRVILNILCKLKLTFGAVKGKLTDCFSVFGDSSFIA